ncbi:uncharacterized protein LOC131632625 [Vicia villosa]|uniref:uncharacterized protein LOC131632625 n=1 Tax=Vicia villosa TaxID=3911 RepID=UPI00273A83DA|nr:uncharacterized protein LOC131632625 [Vicia villosa]
MNRFIFIAISFILLKGVVTGKLRMSASNLVAEKVWKEIESTQTVNDDQLYILHFLFGKNFEGASRIVDQRGAKRISGEPSGRFIFQVTGESRKKDQYLCFAENFCASFFYDVVNRGEQLCCKHQLAARLAASLGSYVEVKNLISGKTIGVTKEKGRLYYLSNEPNCSKVLASYLQTESSVSSSHSAA